MSTAENTAESTEARITFLEDKLAYTYGWFATRAPGVKVKEEGIVADIWAELDFLYLATEASA